MSLSVVSELSDAPNPDGDTVPELRTEASAHTEAELLADLLPGDDAPPARLSDVRADVPISEISERFLRALLLKVPLDRVEELYLFAPLRQGAVETGIAVIAARAHIEPATILADSVGADAPIDARAIDGPAAAEASVDPVSAIDDAATAVPAIDAVAAIDDDAAMVPAAIPDATTPDAQRDEIASAEVEVESSKGFITEMEFPSDDDSPYAPEFAPEAVVRHAETLPEIPEFVARTEEVLETRPPVRHTVYTARYRLVVKGPDRGKWEIDVVDEADAPLLTIETVVRGVQRRAGEETETVRYSGPQLARALRIDIPGHTAA